MLKNSGGPAGYLYNIHEFLKNTSKIGSNIEIVFLKDILGIKNVENSMHVKHSKLMKIIHLIDFFSLIGYYRFFKMYRKWNTEFTSKNLFGLNYNEYDVIHFHNSTQVLCSRGILKDYKGIIVLTSHSPQPLSYEKLDLLPHNIPVLRKFFSKKLIRLEIEAWDFCDYLMFPVKDAIEPYLVNEKIKSYVSTHQEKIIYCPSAILNKPISNNEDLRKKLGIDPNTFLICYIGRHNIIKGYDQLLELGKRILKDEKEINFVIAGVEDPLKGLSHCRWKELGWINYGPELIACADVFVLPNKETYFDLITLEVMREGTPIMLSITGGNKYFQQYGQDYGFYFYNYGDIDSEIKLIEKIEKEKQSGLLNVKRQRIRNLFESQFTIEEYINRYRKLMANIIGVKN